MLQRRSARPHGKKEGTSHHCPATTWLSGAICWVAFQRQKSPHCGPRDDLFEAISDWHRSLAACRGSYDRVWTQRILLSAIGSKVRSSQIVWTDGVVNRSNRSLWIPTFLSCTNSRASQGEQSSRGDACPYFLSCAFYCI
jgi:hypothetical protein